MGIGNALPHVITGCVVPTRTGTEIRTTTREEGGDTGLACCAQSALREVGIAAGLHVEPQRRIGRAVGEIAGLHLRRAQEHVGGGCTAIGLLRRPPVEEVPHP